MTRTEEIVRLTLDFAESRVGHDGTVKSTGGEVERFARWLDENPAVTVFHGSPFDPERT